MITKLNEYNSEPDLREMTPYVKCIKPIYLFKVGEIYKVKHMTGDPQGAIEKYGINDYVPLVCIYFIRIEFEKGSNHLFAVNKHNKDNKMVVVEEFLNYFELFDESKEAEKYNF